ncbi:MAG: class I SAM-dependent methyltransferase [bacterium]
MTRNLFRTIKQFTSKGGIEGWFAEKYDKFAKKVLMDEYKRIACSVTEQLKNGKVLEIGPGPGYISIELSKLGAFQIIGLDISETMIEIAKRNAKDAGAELKFELGDASNMPFEDNTFDFVVSSGSLHHWKKPIKVFNEACRILNSKGRALICDLRKDISREEISKLLEKIDSFIMRWGLKHSIKDSYNKEEIIELVSKTKFKTCQVKENPIDLEIWLKK